MDNTTLKEVEELAALNYTPKEIALITGLDYIDIEEWLQDDQSVFYRAFHRGMYKTDALVRKSIIKLAQSGSSPAQALYIKLQEANELKKKYE